MEVKDLKPELIWKCFDEITKVPRPSCHEEKIREYLLEFAKNVLFLYLGTVGAYALISYVVYTIRYSRASKSLRTYYMNLHKLSAMYKNEKRD